MQNSFSSSQAENIGEIFRARKRRSLQECVLNLGLNIKRTFGWLSGVWFQTQTIFSVICVFSSLRLGSSRSYGTAGGTRNGRVHSELLLLLLKTNMYTVKSWSVPGNPLTAQQINKTETHRKEQQPRNVLYNHLYQTHLGSPHTLSSLTVDSSDNETLPGFPSHLNLWVDEIGLSIPENSACVFQRIFKNFFLRLTIQYRFHFLAIQSELHFLQLSHWVVWFLRTKIPTVKQFCLLILIWTALEVLRHSVWILHGCYLSKSPIHPGLVFHVEVG